jgi:hypothetical protein
MIKLITIVTFITSDFNFNDEKLIDLCGIIEKDQKEQFILDIFT